MQMVATDVQTADIKDEFELWGETYKNAYLHANECRGDARTTQHIILVDSGWESLYLLKPALLQPRATLWNAAKPKNTNLCLNNELKLLRKKKNIWIDKTTENSIEKKN